MVVGKHTTKIVQRMSVQYVETQRDVRRGWNGDKSSNYNLYVYAAM